MISSPIANHQKIFIYNAPFPRLSGSIFVAVFLCFLPLPQVIPSVHTGSIAILLTLLYLPLGMVYLGRKTPGRWCYLSIMFVAFLEVAIAPDFDLKFITFLCSAIGPMFIVMVEIRTHKDLNHAVNIVMWCIFFSVIFGLLIFFLGEPFASLREWLLPATDGLIAADDEWQGLMKGAAGLRGSVYMFGYDLSVLVALLIGSILYALAKKRTQSLAGFWLVFILMMAATLVSAIINGQRIVILNIFILCTISLFISRRKLHFYILMLVMTAGFAVLLLGGVNQRLDFYSRLEEKAVDAMVNLRLQLIDTALYALKVEPLSPKKVYDALVPTCRGEPLPPHVHFLTILVRYGILTLPFVLYVFWKLGRCIARGLSYSHERSKIMLVLAMVTTVVYGLAHNPGPWLLVPPAVLLLSLFGKCLDLGSVSGKCGNK